MPEDFQFRSRLDERIFLNALNGGLSAEELSVIVRDDPEYGSSAGRGLSAKAAAKLLEYRKTRPDNVFRDIAEVAKAPGIGEDTFRDLILSFARLPLERKVSLFLSTESDLEFFTMLIQGVEPSAFYAILEFRSQQPGGVVSSVEELLERHVIAPDDCGRIAETFKTNETRLRALDRLDLAVALKDLLKGSAGAVRARASDNVAESVAMLRAELPAEAARALEQIYGSAIATGGARKDERVADIVFFPMIADNLKAGPPHGLLDPVSIPGVSLEYGWVKTGAGAILEPLGEGRLEILTPDGWSEGLTVTGRIYIEPLPEGVAVRSAGTLIASPAPAVRITCRGGVRGKLLGGVETLSGAARADEAVPSGWEFPGWEIWIDPIPGMPPLKYDPAHAGGCLPTGVIVVVIKLADHWEDMIARLEDSRQLLLEHGAPQWEIDGYDSRLRTAWESALKSAECEFGYLEHVENTVSRAPGNEKWSVAVEADDKSGSADIAASSETQTVNLKERSSKLLDPKSEPKNYFLLHENYGRDRFNWERDGRLLARPGEPVSLVYLDPCCGHPGPGVGVELESPGVCFVDKGEPIRIKANGLPLQFLGVSGQFTFRCIAHPKGAAFRFDPEKMPTAANSVNFFTDTPGVYTFKVDYQLLDASGPWTYAVADAQVVFKVKAVTRIHRLGAYDGELAVHRDRAYYRERTVREQRGAEVRVAGESGGPLGQGFGVPGSVSSRTPFLEHAAGQGHLRGRFRPHLRLTCGPAQPVCRAPDLAFAAADQTRGYHRHPVRGHSAQCRRCGLDRCAGKTAGTGNHRPGHGRSASGHFDYAARQHRGHGR